MTVLIAAVPPKANKPVVPASLNISSVVKLFLPCAAPKRSLVISPKTAPVDEAPANLVIFKTPCAIDLLPPVGAAPKVKAMSPATAGPSCIMVL